MSFVVGVSVTKEFTWRSVAEEFSNVYHYACEAAGLTEADYDALGNAVVELERPLFGSATTFKRYRVWGPSDAVDKKDIQMLAIGDVSGGGSATATSVSLPREMAICPFVYIGRGPKGGKQFLRKYWHVAQMGTSVTDEMAKGNIALSAGDIGYWANKLETFFSVNASLVTWDLANKYGKKVPTGAQAECLPHLHTRNLHR